MERRLGVGRKFFHRKVKRLGGGDNALLIRISLIICCLLSLSTVDSPHEPSFIPYSTVANPLDPVPGRSRPLTETCGVDTDMNEDWHRVHLQFSTSGAH